MLPQVLQSINELELFASVGFGWLAPIELQQGLIEPVAQPLQPLADHYSKGMGGIHHPTWGLLPEIPG